MLLHSKNYKQHKVPQNRQPYLGTCKCSRRHIFNDALILERQQNITCSNGSLISSIVRSNPKSCTLGARPTATSNASPDIVSVVPSWWVQIPSCPAPFFPLGLTLVKLALTRVIPSLANTLSKVSLASGSSRGTNVCATRVTCETSGSFRFGSCTHDDSLFGIHHNRYWRQCRLLILRFFLGRFAKLSFVQPPCPHEARLPSILHNFQNFAPREPPWHWPTTSCWVCTLSTCSPVWIVIIVCKYTTMCDGTRRAHFTTNTTLATPVASSYRNVLHPCDPVQ